MDPRTARTGSMATKLTKSKTFAVLTNGTALDVFFIHRMTVVDYRPVGGDRVGHDAVTEKKLVWSTQRLPWTEPYHRNVIIQLLANAGLTVRFYDPEEKKWMETSLVTGVQPCEGNRDGSWGIPDLETFEKSYLRQ